MPSSEEENYFLFATRKYFHSEQRQTSSKAEYRRPWQSSLNIDQCNKCEM